MKLSILSLARSDLKEIHMYLSEYGENPPKKFREHFEKFCSQVLEMPLMFGQYKYNIQYRRAVIIFDYQIFYRIDEDKVMIYRVLHSRRNTLSLLL